MSFTMEDFVRESNRIEGIYREPLDAEIEATHKLVEMSSPKVFDMMSLVAVYEPGARIRNEVGLDVRVGSYIAPAGGSGIPVRLEQLLDGVSDPWELHVAYEALHPFTDGNGRSGRALWLWAMLGRAPLGFLHHFYYQTLERMPR